MLTTLMTLLALSALLALACTSLVRHQGKEADPALVPIRIDTRNRYRRRR